MIRFEEDYYEEELSYSDDNCSCGCFSCSLRIIQHTGDDYSRCY